MKVSGSVCFITGTGINESQGWPAFLIPDKVTGRQRAKLFPAKLIRDKSFMREAVG